MAKVLSKYGVHGIFLVFEQCCYFFPCLDFWKPANWILRLWFLPIWQDLVRKYSSDVILKVTRAAIFLSFGGLLKIFWEKRRILEKDLSTDSKHLLIWPRLLYQTSYSHYVSVTTLPWLVNWSSLCQYWIYDGIPTVNKRKIKCFLRQIPSYFKQVIIFNVKYLHHPPPISLWKF